MNLKCIAFDLDDTLIDTSNLLVPIASQQACSEMRRQGLNCSMEICLQERKELAQHFNHREIFRKIAEKYSPQNIESLTDVGIQNFYNPQLPTVIPPMDGALEVLKYLQPKYQLFLVTTGAIETQEKKIKAFQYHHLFKKVFIFNSFKNEKKDVAFKEIIQSEKIQPQQLLSIGNRLYQEIRLAKKLGAQTCYFAYGEHVGEKPIEPADHPDYTVYSHRELIQTCQL